MSIKATNAVWDHSQTVGTARCVMALIADSANDAGWHSFDKQEVLAKKANASLRTVERCIETAIALGELEVHRPDRSGRNQYSVMLPGLAIFEDPEERVLRDEHYSKLALGRAAQTIVNREKRVANRRSEDPSPVSGPSSTGPVTSVGSSDEADPSPVSGDHPSPTSGDHPSPVSGLKETNNLNTNETPKRELALAAETFWSCYPHQRRNMDAARTLDLFTALDVDDVTSIEQIARALTEDLASKNWQEGYVPKLTNWLKDRMWDRPLGDVTQLNPLAGIELSDPDPEFDREARALLGDDVADIWLSQCWHGRRGETYVLGGTDRAIGWLGLRYGRVLERIAKQLQYAGLELVNAIPPQVKENAA